MSREFPRTARRGPLVAALVAVIAVWEALADDAPRGWLGVTLRDANQAASLTRVFPGSPAALAELRAGDVVLAVGGRRIRSARDLTRIVTRRRPGSVLPLTLARGGAETFVSVALAARPADLYPLLERDRDAWQEPDRVLAALEIGPGSVVADLGAGSGYFTERLATHVGPRGRVVAVDIDPEALAQLTSRFRHAAYTQVVIQRGGASDPGLDPASLDAVLLVDSYHELEHPEAMLAALRRALRPHARLVVVDRAASTYTPGAHAIPEARVVEQAETAGFTLRERQDLPQQFLLVLEARDG